MDFMQADTAKYDFLFLDIFKGRVVPPFVYTSGFLAACKSCLAPGGRIAFNYIVNNKEEWEQVKNIFTSVFPDNRIIASSVNRILIGSR
jgi:spermidine synthase